MTHNLVKKLDNWWTLNYEGIKYDSTHIAGKVKHAIVDTGTSFLYLPNSEFQDIKKEFLAIDGIECDEYCVSYNKTCNEIVPYMKNLTIMMDGVQYTMPPAAYVLTPNPKMYKEKCLIPVSPLPDSAGLAILGDTFIRNYYTSFDFDKNTVTFAPNAAHEFGAVVEKDESFVVFILLIVVILLFTGICVLF